MESAERGADDKISHLASTTVEDDEQLDANDHAGKQEKERRRVATANSWLLAPQNYSITQ